MSNKNALEMCLLAQLAESDGYAYQLASVAAKTITLREGVVYPLLRRLVNESHVSTYLVESASGPPRKFYRLESSGVTRLARLRHPRGEPVLPQGAPT